MNQEYYLYLTYELNKTGGGIVDGDEDCEFPDYEPSFIDIKFLNLYINDPNIVFMERVGIDFDPSYFKNAYVVVVRYEEGDTFGWSSGNWEVVGIYSDKERAENIVNQINNDTYMGYKPWEGYFEKLESVSILEMSIE